MKIGTITFYEIEENYGCILQCYALPKYLKLIGHDAFFIKSRYEVPAVPMSFPLRQFRRFWPWLIHPVRNYRKREQQKAISANIKQRKLQAAEHPRFFQKFMSDYIPATEKIYSQTDLMNDPPNADVYICGSDQIWGGVNPTMYLRFAPQGSKKLSYAASFGGLVPDNNTQRFIKESIADFDLVTLREESGVELCREKLGRGDALLVPDPTLLLHAEDYREVKRTIEIKRHSKRPVIFLYLLGNTMAVDVQEIMEFAHSHDMDVKYVASNGRIDEYPKIFPTVEEWLALIDESSYVITNSFHGTVFSLIFKKKFMTIPLTDAYKRMNVRINTLLNNVNMNNRIYQGDFNAIFNEIDFSSFEIYQNSEIERVTKLLNQVL